MAKSSVVALVLTLATSADVSAAPRATRVLPAALRAMPTPPPLPTARAEAERVAALLDRHHPPPGTMQVAARWTHEAPYGPATLAGDRAVWIEGETLHALSLRDGAAAATPATLAARWRRLPPQQRIESIDVAGGALAARAVDGVTEVLAFGNDGETRWRTPLPARFLALRAGADTLFAFEGDPTVWRLDPRSGRVAWTHPSAKPIADVVPLAPGLVAVVRSDDLVLLDGAGRELSTRPRNPHVVGFAVHDARLFSCIDDGTLQAVDLASGRALWWARVSTGDESCAVLGATADRVLIDRGGRWIALDTTRPAPSAAPVTIRGRYRDVENPKARLRGLVVHVGKRRVRTDARGRFAATVRTHGPIEVRVDGIESYDSRTVVWPDEQGHDRIELSNHIDDSCH